MPDSLPDAAPPRRRVQFTVRTFFVAAVLISLFAAAASLPGMKVRIVAITVLAWLAFAGLYWTLHAIAPLVALPVGSVVLMILWCLVLPFVRVPDLEFAGYWIVVPAVFSWGIAFSIIVALSRMLRHLSRRLRGCLPRTRRGQCPFHQEVRPARSALEMAGYVLLARLMFSVLPLAAKMLVAWSSWSPPQDPEIISLAIDMPLAPLVMGITSPPDSNLAFILATTVLACPLYAGAGWVVGLVLARRDRSVLSAACLSPQVDEAPGSPEPPGPASPV